MTICDELRIQFPSNTITIIFQAATEKKKQPEDVEVPKNKQKKKSNDLDDQKVDEEINEDSYNIKGEELTKKQKEDDHDKTKVDTTANLEPLPSTSGKTMSEHSESSKRYKTSLAYLQFRWCQTQPDFLELREKMVKDHK